jgi:hypothetical protein
MRCTIEMNTLRVLHVNYAQSVVDSLARLEAPAKGVPYHVLQENTANSSFLQNLTELELTTLYRNLTDKEIDPAVGKRVMRSAIAHVVNNLPVREALNDELSAQLHYARENPGPVYRYVKGSMLPAIPEAGLWPVKGVHLSQAEFDAAQLDAARLSEREATPVPTAPKKAPSRPAVVPTGGSRPVIWAHADKVWEAAGKPMDQGVVLKLRKQMMIDLEGEGIKKSTSSTALGDWMKARLAGA